MFTRKYRSRQLLTLLIGLFASGQISGPKTEINDKMLNTPIIIIIYVPYYKILP